MRILTPLLIAAIVSTASPSYAQSTPTPSPSPAAQTSPSPIKKRMKRAMATQTASPGATTAKSTSMATPAAGGGNGQVWVNTETHVYHKEGSRFYGKTKHGKYMSEDAAIKEGDHLAKGKGQ